MIRLSIVAATLSLAITVPPAGPPPVQPTERPPAPPPAASQVRAAPAEPAATGAPTLSFAVPPPSPEPAAVLPRSVTSTGMVGPLPVGALPCFADRYACETYDFSLTRKGSIEVTVTWEGPPRALLVQLYWAGEGLAHEDVAPREGPSRIWFRRPLMEASDYRLRVVSLEPGSTVPFTLTVTY